jgi:hypothetical protein
MSRSGILVEWSADGLLSRLPKPGDALTVDIELPANHSFGRRCMHCQTVVARVGPGEKGEPTVALQVNQMQFRDYGDGRHSCETTQDEIRCSVM